MHLLRSIILAANVCSVAQAFAPPLSNTVTHHVQTNTPLTKLYATETEAERLLRKARALREEVKAGEDELHTTLIQRKKTRDAATDSIISQLFPANASDEEGVCALCERLREKRLASDMLVRVVERLHEREVAARGLEHVEPSMHHDQVTFKRVAQPDDVELNRIQGLVDRLIEAAEVLDKEFIDQKSECQGVIVSDSVLKLFDLMFYVRVYKMINALTSLYVYSCFYFSRLIAISCIGAEEMLLVSSKTRQRI